MGYAFISYSTKNQASADALKHLLDKRGIASWMAPGDIPAGSKYAQVINQAIKDCSCVILLLTEASQSSTWVSKEIERAINYKKTIIPIQLEDVVLNDEFEFYISTDQIVAVRMIDENSKEIKKVLESIVICCGSTMVSKQNDKMENIEHMTATDVQYRITFSTKEGSLFLYSKESSSKEKALSYSMSQEEWDKISGVVESLTAILFHTKKDFVSVTPYDQFKNKKCAPLDGHSYYDSEFRINFGIQFLGGNDLKMYDSVRVDVSDKFLLTFYKKGDYIYKTVPTDSTLTDFNLDETECVKFSKKLLECLYPNKKIIVAENFHTKIYSDLSGGFILDFIVK